MSNWPLQFQLNLSIARQEQFPTSTLERKVPIECKAQHMTFIKSSESLKKTPTRDLTIKPTFACW